MILKIKWEDEQSLRDLIETCYFLDNNGVLRNNATLTINNTDVNYTILKKLDCTVKVVSKGTIKGTMKFLKQEVADSIILKPISIYCIKMDNTYSFY